MAAKKIDSLNIIGQEKEPGSGMSRRDFIKVGAVAAAVGAVGCADSPRQDILPYVKGEAESIPGVAVWYASTCTECSAGCGIQVKTREGRIIKVEGSKDSPINRGGLCAQGQASLQGLYDPDRVRQPLAKSDDGTFAPISWDAAYKKISKALGKNKKKTALVSDSLTGAMSSLAGEWSTALGADHVVYESGDANAVAKGAELAFGVSGVPGYKFENADILLNFGADFLETWISPCEYARGWAQARKKNKLKFIHVEPRLSLTGANADKWLGAKPGTELLIAQSVLKLILERGAGSNLEAGVREQIARSVKGASVAQAANDSGLKEAQILLVVEFLLNAKAPLVIAGGAAGSTSNGVDLQVVVNFINLALGSVGKTVDLSKTRKVASSPSAMAKLVDGMKAGDYGVMFVSGTNPVFTLSQDFGFDYAAKMVPFKVSFSSTIDETARGADLILPAHTGLESWGSAEPVSGVYALQQPAMSSVFDTQHLGDMLLRVAKDAGQDSVGGESQDFYSYLKNAWKEVHTASGSSKSFEKFWLACVEHGGWFPEKSDSSVKVEVNPQAFKRKFKKASFEGKGLIVYPYPSVKGFNGQSANKPWLQELPDPITSVSWSSWVELHPDTAKEHGLKQGDAVTLRNDFGEITVPAYVTDHVSPGVAAVPRGQGHSEYGRFARRVASANVFSLVGNQVTSDDVLPLVANRAEASRGNGKPLFTIMQGSDDQGDREIAQTEYRAVKSSETESDHHGHDDHGHDDHHGHHEPKQMYEQREHPLYDWAMSVDLEACTGCSACIVACYAENNIATVGPEHVAEGREMAWLRIERYMDKNPSEELKVSFMPMMCQQCNNAPCEPVCPVYATYHTEEGLNAMVYNRCVGTRYCANNCSYKVRRYNWFEYDFPEPMNWQLNPDVTKRTAGVMEKCSFCVQRINTAKDRAKDIGRPVLDGEIQPACVQSCPTQALVFGNINDETSKIAKLVHDERAYKVLDHHINTQPSVSYLKDVKYTI